MITPVNHPIQVVEPLHGPWLYGGKWGGAVRFAENTFAAGVEYGVLNVDEFPGPPRIRAVQLRSSAEFPVDGEFIGEAGNVFPRARLRWGVGGARYQADVDWGPGTQFGLLCSSLQIELIGETANITQPVAPLPYASEFTAAVGVRGEGLMPPTWTSPTSTLQSPIEFRGRVPAFGRRAYPFVNGALSEGDSILVQFFSSITRTFDVSTADRRTLLFSQGIPISQDRAWRFAGGDFSDASWGMIFELGL